MKCKNIQYSKITYNVLIQNLKSLEDQKKNCKKYFFNTTYLMWPYSYRAKKNQNFILLGNNTYRIGLKKINTLQSFGKKRVSTFIKDNPSN